MHSAGDENYERGYEWWLMTEAKKVGPCKDAIFGLWRQCCLSFHRETQTSSCMLCPGRTQHGYKCTHIASHSLMAYFRK